MLASCDWGWEEKPNGVDRLSYPTEVDLSCDLFDEDRCESLGAQFFVDTKIINFTRAKDAGRDQSQARRECTRKLTFDARGGSSERQR